MNVKRIISTFLIFGEQWRSSASGKLVSASNREGLRMTYLRIEAGHPSFVVPRDVTKMKWLTFALVAADLKTFCYLLL